LQERLKKCFKKATNCRKVSRKQKLQWTLQEINNTALKESNTIARKLKESEIAWKLKENNIAWKLKESNNIVWKLKESNNIVWKLKESNKIVWKLKESKNCSES